MFLRVSLLSLAFLWGCTSTKSNMGNDNTVVLYQALGTQPQWSVEIMKAKISFYSEDFDTKQNFDVSESEDGEFKSYQNTDNAQKFSLVLEEKQCLDQITTQDMPYVATFTFGDITYLGCAQKINQ